MGYEDVVSPIESLNSNLTAASGDFSQEEPDPVMYNKSTASRVCLSKLQIFDMTLFADHSVVIMPSLINAIYLQF